MTLGEKIESQKNTLVVSERRNGQGWVRRTYKPAIISAVYHEGPDGGLVPVAYVDAGGMIHTE